MRNQRRTWLVALSLLLAAGAVLLLRRLWPCEISSRELSSSRRLYLPVLEQFDGRIAVRFPGQVLVAEVGECGAELPAYLLASQLRGTQALQGVEVLLTYRETILGPVYPIVLRLPNDLLTSVPLLARLRTQGLIPREDWRAVPQEVPALWQQESRLFAAVHDRNRLARRTPRGPSTSPPFACLPQVPRPRRMATVQGRTKSEPRWRSASDDEPSQLATDLLAVARFFDLPLSLLLDTRAVDSISSSAGRSLGRAVWKEQAAQSDVVLKRRRGRVLTLDDSSGDWQVTRETLGYAHRRYLVDTRDYSRLPARLRPPRELRPKETPPRALTAYAGLVLRELLERQQGDVARAVAAYNAEPSDPDVRHEPGVRRVVLYARRLLDQASALNSGLEDEIGSRAVSQRRRGRE